jgi:hypothetical protein
MNVNPYAPPQAQEPTAARPGAFAATSQPWEIGEVLNTAFEGLKANWVVLVFTQLLAFVIGEALVLGQRYLPFMPKDSWVLDAYRSFSLPVVAVGCAGMLVGSMIHAYFQVGLLRLSLGVARGQRVSFGMLFGGIDRFVPMFVAYLATLLGMSIGLVLLVVPGIILAVGLTFSSYFIIDQEMGPIEGILASWHVTEGQRGQVFLLVCAEGLVLSGALLLCVLPFFVAVPTCTLATTIVYLRMTRGGRSA